MTSVSVSVICDGERLPVQGRLAALLMLGCVASGPAAAATLVGLPSNQRNVIVTLDGDIAKGDAETLARLIKNTNDDGRIVAGLRLNSVGGNLVESVKLAELVRQARLPTMVATGAHCASACFIVFAAGAPTFASYGGLVGVHGASDGSGLETVESGAATISMARILKEYGVPPAIIGKMVVTPPNEIAWLSPDDLRQMGTVLTGRPAGAPIGKEPPVAAAKPPAPPPDTLAQYRKAISAAGRGNYTVAARIWLALAAQGDGPAQYNAGQLYYEGRGVPQSYAEATSWFRRAAQQGVPEAQQNLGIAYAVGRGVPRDYVEAHKWLALSAMTLPAAEDREQAAQARDMIATRMTGTQLADAERLAREWTAAHRP